MKLMALELDNKDIMMIPSLLLCKRDDFKNQLLDCRTQKQIPEEAFPWKFL